jgi:Ca2+-binding EF-hand superfamily protein
MAGSGTDKLNLKKFMKNLLSALNDQNLSVEELFSQMDTDKDGRINGPELHKGLNNLAGEYLSPGQISIIIQSMDKDADNRIDLSELRTAIESAK